MFDVVREAQAAAVSRVRAGSAARDVHRTAVEVIDATEFAGRFIHGTGHSIGLDVHDGGGLSDASELTLEAGMIMTVEPGVYVPGVGGVRIEDTVLVTDGDPEILTPVTKDLVEVPA
jgi:Xaa-Pro dipeptidase